MESHFVDLCDSPGRANTVELHLRYEQPLRCPLFGKGYLWFFGWVGFGFRARTSLGFEAGESNKDRRFRLLERLGRACGEQLPVAAPRDEIVDRIATRAIAAETLPRG